MGSRNNRRPRHQSQYSGSRDFTRGHNDDYHRDQQQSTARKRFTAPRDEYQNDVSRNHKRLTRDEEIELHARARSGDAAASAAARETLICSQLPLVMSLAKKYIRPLVEFDDLVQEGNVALIVAVDRFDPARARLTTFSTLLIGQRMYRYAESFSSVIRRPPVVNVSSRNRQAYESAGRIDDIEGYADFLWTTPADPDDLMIANALSRAIEELCEKHKDIILQRLSGEPLLSIGKSYGCSREWVRKIEVRAVSQLRHKMRDQGIEI